MIPEKGKTNKVIPTFIPTICLGHFPTMMLGGGDQANHRRLTELRRLLLESGATDVAGN